MAEIIDFDRRRLAPKPPGRRGPAEIYSLDDYRLLADNAPLNIMPLSQYFHVLISAGNFETALDNARHYERTMQRTSRRG